MPLGRRTAIAWIVIANLAITVGLLEVVLRAQQKIGPLYDLDPDPSAIIVGLSDDLNHVHLPSREWDGDGIRRMNEANATDCSVRLLFMGDSFMEGLTTDDTVPVHVRHFFGRTKGREICVFNAACSTYSPSIFTVQAKRLIPKLEPDFVLIDVDETDIYDDYHRYRELVTRDASGSIAAVRRTPITARFQQGLVDATDKVLYLHRLFAKLYFTKVEYPAAFARYAGNRPADLFWLSRLPAAEARTRYPEAIDYFETTLDDLTSSVAARMGGPERLIFLHHPHLEHLRANGAFNGVVSTTIRKVAARYGVRYYDATEDLKAEFGDKATDYYILDDMHLNALGLRAYGLAVAKYLAREIAH